MKKLLSALVAFASVAPALAAEEKKAEEKEEARKSGLPRLLL